MDFNPEKSARRHGMELCHIPWILMSRLLESHKKRMRVVNQARTAPTW